MRDKFSFIYFDVGNVLFDFEDYYEGAAREFNQPVKMVREAFAEVDDDLCRGKISPDQLIEIYREKLMIHNWQQRIDDYFSSYFKPINETHDLVGELSQRFRLGLLTNMWGRLYETAWEKKLIPNVDFEVVIRSDVEGVIKPEKEIYLVAMERAKVSGDKIMLVDDKVENIDAAKEHGWGGVVFDKTDVKRSIQLIQDMLV